MGASLLAAPRRADGGTGSRPTDAVGSGGGQRDDPGRRAEYFGTVAYGERFVYLLDMSTSMNWNRHGPPGVNSRLDRARYELLSSVSRLAEDQWFYVILFCGHTRRMVGEAGAAPRMVPATRENKERLGQRLGEVRMGSRTDPREALEIALSLAPDAVFILSDGDFNGRGDRTGAKPIPGIRRTADIVAEENVADAPIHTVAYEDPSSKARMRQLAELTGGRHRYIPPLAAHVQAEARRSRPPARSR